MTESLKLEKQEKISMNIYSAEMFRYRKSFFSKIVFVGIIVFAILTTLFLNYVSHGVSSEFLQIMGLPQNAVDLIKDNLYGFRYVAISLSAAGILMIPAGFPVVIHVSSDYQHGTLRYEQLGSKTRMGCYVARSLAAASFGVILLWEYGIVSLLMSILFFHGDLRLTDAGQVLVIMLIQSVVVFAFMCFLYLICDLIRNQILSMAVLFLMILLFTPGLELLLELLELNNLSADLWIVSMLTVLSDYNIDAKNAVSLILVSVLYIIISILIGSAKYKKRRI